MDCYSRIRNSPERALPAICVEPRKRARIPHAIRSVCREESLRDRIKSKQLQLKRQEPGRILRVCQRHISTRERRISRRFHRWESNNERFGRSQTRLRFVTQQTEPTLLRARSGGKRACPRGQGPAVQGRYHRHH